MTDRFESILDESISALQAGVPVDEILAETPEYAGELRPLLYAAMVLADPKPELVPEERKAALRAEYLAQAAELPPVAPTLTGKLQAVFNIVKKRLTRQAVLNDLVTMVITVMLTLTMSALILTYAASDTIPGDLLYGVKRASETIQLALTFDPTRQAELADTFNQERITEIELLLKQNRAASVQFKGVLDSKGETLWIIEGLNIALAADTIVQGNPQEGDKVEVIGLLRPSNVLVADSLKKVE
jgi:hypothetical protein